MATYVNDLRLKEIATGDESGTWGTSTNTNLELIAEAFSFGTEAITTNADTHTTTIADGSTDPGRSIYLQYTGTLDSTCTITIGPNTVSKLWFIENATSGSQSIIIKQGSGATVTIRNGDVKAIYSDGAGSGGKMVDAFTDLHVNGLTSEVDDNEAALTVRSTDADASSGPLIVFDRESSSPADGDTIGRLSFQGKNDAGEDTTYARIRAGIVDASDGTEDGLLQLASMLDGTVIGRMEMTATETVFNEGSKDLDFRVETDTDANALFVQGSSNRVMLGFNAQIAVAGVNPHLGVVGTDNGGTTLGVVRYSADTSGCRFILGKSRNGSIATAGGTIVQSGDTVGLIQFAADDGGDVATKPVQIAAAIDGTPGSDDVPGRLVISTVPDGSATIAEALRITNAGNIGIGDSSPSTKLHVTTSDQDDGITIECTNGGASAGPSLKLDRSSSGPADDDSIGEIEFSGRNDASQAVQYARIFARAADVTDGTEDGELEIQTMLAGTAKSRVEFNRTETVFNEDGENLDFRVETPNSTKFFFVDAGLGRVRFGNATHRQAGSNPRILHASTNGADAGLTLNRHQDSTSSAALVFGKSRGTADSDVTVVQDGDTLGVIQFAGADGTDILTLAADIKAVVDGTPGSNDMPGSLVFSTTPDGANSRTERMRIDSSGNVGIGQSSPAADLEIKRSGASTLRLTNALNAQSANDIIGEIEFYSADNSSPNDSVRADITAINEDDSNNVALAFGTAASGGNVTEQMRINSDGNLLIGTTSPVTNFSNTAQFVAFKATDGVCAKFICDQTTVTSADNPIIEVSFQDDTSLGNGSRFMIFTDENSTVGTIQSASTTSLEFGTGSDERLKENIVDAPSQLDKILDLNVRQFDWKKTGESEIGFVAQEVHKVLPNCASEGGDDPSKNPWSIFKAAFAPYLVSAIQEQQKQIEELKLEIAKLREGGS